MFGRFKKKPVDQQIVDESNDSVYNNTNYNDINTGNPYMYQVPPRRPPPVPAPCLYTVGNTLDGSTVLRITDNENYSTTTLTMNAPSVKQLIRMLKASLTEEEDDDDA